MAFKVSLLNGEGDEIDSRMANSEAGAAKAAAEMILSAGELYEGDSISVKEIAANLQEAAS